MTASTIRSGEAGLLSTAQTLADLAREVAPTAEADRALAPDLLDALRAQGLFALGVPRSLGGGECPPGEALVAAETIARGDASPGWCVSIATTSGLLGAYLPDEGAQEVFGDPRSAAAGVWAPRGRGQAVDGGVCLSVGEEHIDLRAKKPAELPQQRQLRQGSGLVPETFLGDELGRPSREGAHDRILRVARTIANANSYT